MFPRSRSPINRRVGSCSALCRRKARWAVRFRLTDGPARKLLQSHTIYRYVNECLLPARQPLYVYRDRPKK